MPPPVTATVPARAALAGNPSDLYRGAVLAVPVHAFAARVDIADAPATRIDGVAEGEALVTAAIDRVPQPSPFTLRWTTDIPHTVGLAGSSAIVIAVLRALAARADRSLPPFELAALALEIEADELGIVAGIQDRAVQAAGEPILVDVAADTPVITAVMPGRPLQVVVAWSAAAAGGSGEYHRDLRARVNQTVDPDGMAELGRIARVAAVEFGAGNAPALAELMAESAAVRSRVAPLSSAHGALAEAVAATGLRPNSAGSGGAVSAVVTDEAQVDRLADALAAVGGRFVVETYGE